MAEEPARGVVARILDRLARRLSTPHVDAARSLRRDVAELRSAMERLDRRLDALASIQRQQEQVLTRTGDLGAIRGRLDRLVSDYREQDTQARLLRRQVSALVRAQYLPTDLPAPHWLQARRFHLRAQHEEDGIVLALLAEAGVSTRRFLEIGSGSTGGNSAVLAHDMGWGGVMIELKRSAVERLRDELRFNPAVTVIEAAVTPASIDALLRAHGVEGEIDLLSIDIDSTDYWIFEAITACRPRVVVLEYNAHFGPTRAVTLPPSERPASAPKQYFGASLAALEKLARRKGFRLVHCESEGVNAFFVREGLAPALPGLTPEAAFRPPRRRVRDRDATAGGDALLNDLAALKLPLVEV